ncbi:MAG: hypothetical protein H6810_03920 [Phycisphaeraceae bacterium]|nr:MAG: hypothetical protein H6810_03920 [Phycisphaeraceae bacterium]
MKRTRSKRILTIGLTLFALGALLPSGCGKPPPPPPPPKKAPPPPPPKPPRVSVAALMADTDSRLQFPAEKAPYDKSLAQAVINFAEALAAGDDTAFGTMLNMDSRGILDGMVGDGTWFESTGDIQAVRLVFLEQTPDEDEHPTSADFVLAVQSPDGAYTLGWEAHATDGGWVMSPLSTADGTRPRAADWDGDSMTAYASAAGWGPSDAAGSPAPSTDAFPGGPDAAVAAYFSQETMRNLLGRDYDKLKEQTDYAAISKAAGINISEDMVNKLLDQGKKLVEDGSRPSSMVVKMLMMQIKTAVGPSLGKAWDDDEILDAMAKALGVSREEMQKIHDG